MIEIRADQLLAELQLVARRGIFHVADDEQRLQRSVPHLCEIARAVYGVRPGEIDLDRVEQLLHSAANQAEMTSDLLEVFEYVEPAALKTLFGLQSSSRYASLKSRQERAGLYYDPPIPYDTMRKVPQMRRHVDALRRGVQFFVSQYGAALHETSFADPLEGTPRPDYLQKLRKAQSDLREKGGFFLAYGPSGYGKSTLSGHLRYSTGPETASVTIPMSIDPLGMSFDLERYLTLEGIDTAPGSDPRTILAAFQRSVARSRKVHLIVLDNVTSWQQVEALFRLRPNVPVLITSQSNLSRLHSARFSISQDHAVEIGPLEIEQATAILCDKNDSLDEDKARKLARLLSGHPLSVDQAARYLKEYGAEYVDELSAELRLNAYDALDDISSLLGIPNGLLLMHSKRLCEIEQSTIQAGALLCIAFYSTDTGIDRVAANQLLQEHLRRRIGAFRFDGSITRLIEAGFILTRGTDLLMHDLTRAIVISLWAERFSQFDDIKLGRPGATIRQSTAAELSPWLKDRHQELFTKSWLMLGRELVLVQSRIDFAMPIFWDYWRVEFSLGWGRRLFCWRPPDLFMLAGDSHRWVRVSNAALHARIEWLFRELLKAAANGGENEVSPAPRAPFPVFELDDSSWTTECNANQNNAFG